MQGKVREFESDKEFMRTLMNNFGHVLVYVFYADWNDHSKKFVENFKQSLEVFGDYDNVKYFFVCAQKCPETLKKWGVQYTPTVLFTQTDKKILKKYESSQNVIADIGTIFEELQAVAEEHQSQFQKDKLVWHPKIKSILESCPIIVFIKGTPTNPKCGFTSTMLQILKKEQAEYIHYDIIQDEYMRYWLRNLKGWPTYPQIFINGQLIGGLDKTKELVANGQFTKMIPKSCRKLEGEEKYQQMIQEHDVLAFIEGFTFENQKSAEIVDKAVGKYGEDKVFMVNAAMDQKLREYLQKNVTQCPFIIEKGKLVQI